MLGPVLRCVLWIFPLAWLSACTYRGSAHWPDITGPRPGTNSFFLTDERTDLSKPLVPTEQQVERCKLAPECRPAERDPEGHWGTPVEGFRLSLRFEKATYSAGEPVIARVVLRNTVDRPLPYSLGPGPVGNQDVRIVLMRGTNRVYGIYDPRPGASFAERVRAVRAGQSLFLAMPVGTQREEPVNLSDIYDLTQEGEYVVYARRKVSNWVRSTNVISGEATFRIVAQK